MSIENIASITYADEFDRSLLSRRKVQYTDDFGAPRELGLHVVHVRDTVTQAALAASGKLPADILALDATPAAALKRWLTGWLNGCVQSDPVPVLTQSTASSTRNLEAG